MKKIIAFTAALAICLTAVPAFTQAGDENGAPSGDVTVYDENAFVGDLVKGDLVIPDGTLITQRRNGKTSDLIRVRSHFVPEILKNVENL
ncbi:MAG: hypothetical protein ABIJ56_12915 [Pseudomonadota bacterium]